MSTSHAAISPTTFRLLSLCHGHFRVLSWTGKIGKNDAFKSYGTRSIKGPHAQLAGDGQGLVQQGRHFLSVARLVSMEQGVGVVAARNSFLVQTLGRLSVDAIFFCGAYVPATVFNCKRPSMRLVHENAFL